MCTAVYRIHVCTLNNDALKSDDLPTWKSFRINHRVKILNEIYGSHIYIMHESILNINGKDHFFFFSKAAI